MSHLAQANGHEGWYTPERYIKAARAVMAGINLDPASSAAANQVVKAAKFYTAEEDGLIQDWSGRVWLNPPYTRGVIDKFIAKMVHEYSAGNIHQAIVLTNNATDTAWFHGLAIAASAWFFPRGRTKFYRIHPDGTQETGPPLQGQVHTYLGPNPLKFIKEFENRIGGIGMGPLTHVLEESS